MPTEYIREDIYFCTGCRQFHDSDSHIPVEVPGMDEFFDCDTGITYKVRKPKNKSTKPKRGFGNPSYN